MSNNNEKTIRRFIEEIINKRDFSVLNELVHSIYVHRSPGEELNGQEELKDFLTGFHNTFPDLHVKIDDLVTTDSKTVISITLSGTHNGDLMGIKATGKKVNINGMVISRFQNGKIIEEWEILDQFTMFQQLGLVSIPV